MDQFARFKEIAERFGWTGGLAVAGATFAPLVTAAAGFATPWPDDLPFLTSLFMLITLIGTFLFGSALTRRAFARAFVLLVIAFVLLVGGYLYSFDRFVRSVPDASPVILGCVLEPESRLVVRSQYGDSASECPGPAARMLEGADYEPAGVWTDESIRSIKLLLLGLWLAMFSMLAGIFSIFVVRTSRMSPAASKRPKAASPPKG